MSYDIIHTYRKKDGTGETELVDVTKEARAEGFMVPVAITRAVHSAYVRIPAGVEGADRGPKAEGHSLDLRACGREAEGQRRDELLTLCQK